MLNGSIVGGDFQDFAGRERALGNVPWDAAPDGKLFLVARELESGQRDEIAGGSELVRGVAAEGAEE
jgi:hypothetical protein